MFVILLLTSICITSIFLYNRLTKARNTTKQSGMMNKYQGRGAAGDSASSPGQPRHLRNNAHHRHQFRRGPQEELSGRQVR